MVIESLSESIVYVSDLHIVSNYMMAKEQYDRMLKFKPPTLHLPFDSLDEYERKIVLYIKDMYPTSFLIIAGDISESPDDTIRFVRLLEDEQIYGAFVLGNHDYWNDGSMTYDDVIDYIREATAEHSYFQYLYSGKKIYLDDLCIIGDSGWTSFRTSEDEGPFFGLTLVDCDVYFQKVFSGLPEMKRVRDFSYQDIQHRHQQWIEFANSVIRTTPNVLVVTHWPMFLRSSLRYTAWDRWWSSYTQLEQGDYWTIFGHTHQRYDKFGQHVCAQIGNTPSLLKEMERRNVGYLVRIKERQLAVQSGKEALLSAYYAPVLSLSLGTVPNHQAARIKKRGFRRVSANMRNLVAYAQDPTQYVNMVSKALDDLRSHSRGEYVWTNRLSFDEMTHLDQALAILIANDTEDIAVFVTSLILTGYVYNHATYALGDMRTVDEFDIVRTWMTLKTIMDLNIDVVDADAIRVHKNPKMAYSIGDVLVYGPSVNGLSVEDETMRLALNQLLPSMGHEALDVPNKE